MCDWGCDRKRVPEIIRAVVVVAVATAAVDWSASQSQAHLTSGVLWKVPTERATRARPTTVRAIHGAVGAIDSTMWMLFGGGDLIEVYVSQQVPNRRKNKQK